MEENKTFNISNYFFDDLGRKLGLHASGQKVKDIYC
jgi:hypothetical protein